MTPVDLITQALRKTGVTGIGMTAQAEDLNDAFLNLNMMLAQWNRKRWLVYHLIEVAVAATGQAAYSIGPGQAFDAPGRVTAIESAFFRYGTGAGSAFEFSSDFNLDFATAALADAMSVDLPLTVIPSREDYSRITLKGQPGVPVAVYLDAGFPFGTVSVWPAPTSGEIHLIVQDTLSAFPDLTTDIALPAEYAEALLYNLAARLRASYGRMPDPTVTALARASLNTIKVANTQIGTLQMPAWLPGTTRGGFGGVYEGGTVIQAPPPAVVVDYNEF